MEGQKKMKGNEKENTHTPIPMGAEE